MNLIHLPTLVGLLVLPWLTLVLGVLGMLLAWRHAVRRRPRSTRSTSSPICGLNDESSNDSIDESSAAASVMRNIQRPRRPHRIAHHVVPAGVPDHALGRNHVTGHATDHAGPSNALQRCASIEGMGPHPDPVAPVLQRASMENAWADLHRQR